MGILSFRDFTQKNLGGLQYLETQFNLECCHWSALFRQNISTLVQVALRQVLNTIINNG